MDTRRAAIDVHGYLQLADRQYLAAIYYCAWLALATCSQHHAACHDKSVL